MTLISLSEVYRIIDDHRGDILAERKQHVKGTDIYGSLSRRLDLLNKLKRQFADVLDTDQKPLGL